MSSLNGLLPYVFVVLAVCRADVSWRELLPLQDTLHLSDYPNRTAPSSTSCIALGTSTQGCSHVTYLYSTSTCHLHSQLQGRQFVKNSRVWSINKSCRDEFTYSEQIRACIYLSIESKSWNESYFDCQTRQASLLVTTTAWKIKAVTSTITGNPSFWVGATITSFSKGKWITGESVEFSDFTFAYNNLNDVGGTDTCLTFTFLAPGDMKLANQRCLTTFRYLCEANRVP